MEDTDLEGTKVLERLAELGKLDDFYEAVDSDNFSRAKWLMKQAKIDAEIASLVLAKMKE